MLLRGSGWLLTGIMAFLQSLPIAAEPRMPTACLGQPVAVEQSSAYIRALTALPTPPFVPVESRGESRFVLSSRLFADVLGVSPRSYIINDIEELRFISYTLAGTPLLLVLKSAPDWTLEKSRKVAAVARISGISISLLWLDAGPIPPQLQITILETKGRTWRLSELTRLIVDQFCDLSGENL